MLTLLIDQLKLPFITSEYYLCVVVFFKPTTCRLSSTLVRGTIRRRENTDLLVRRKLLVFREISVEFCRFPRKYEWYLTHRIYPNVYFQCTLYLDDMEWMHNCSKTVNLFLERKISIFEPFYSFKPVPHVDMYTRLTICRMRNRRFSKDIRAINFRFRKEDLQKVDKVYLIQF